MLSKKSSCIIFLIITLFPPLYTINAQDIDIVPYLKQIEDGNKEQVQGKLPELKKEYKSSANVLFLEGVLTENGQNAVEVYTGLLKKYPHSKYADASLYRIYTYYYALGMYSTARTFLSQLKKDYPESPYLKIAEKNIPEKDNVVGENKKEIPEKIVKNQKPVESGQEVQDSLTIQAGAFSLLANAELLKKEFKRSGYFTWIEDKTVAGTIFHVVYVGNFRNEDEAKKFLQIINSKFSLDGRIVKSNLPGGR